MKSEAKELSDRFGKRYRELTLEPEDLDPLDVTPLGDEHRPFIVEDRRLNKLIELTSVSSSVASLLTIKILLYALSSLEEKPKLIVIEEPEEALAPPQQVVFTKALQRLVNYAYKKFNIISYIIVTTHSPYIAYTLAGKSRLYYVYYERGQGFTTNENLPFSVFALAHYLGTLENHES